MSYQHDGMAQRVHFIFNTDMGSTSTVPSLVSAHCHYSLDHNCLTSLPAPALGPFTLSSCSQWALMET